MRENEKVQFAALNHPMSYIGIYCRTLKQFLYYFDYKKGIKNASQHLKPLKFFLSHTQITKYPY